MTTRKERDQEQAKDFLLNTVGIKPGDTIFCNLKHVSRSGMYRCISLFVMRDNQPWDISWNAATLLEGYDERHNGCKAGGCGMDMGFHLVYNLSYNLFRGGFDCLGVGCPANDHSNKPYPERIAGSMKHKDSGYALRCKWM